MFLIHESVVNVEPCLYTPLGSKAKWSNVNHCVRRIVGVATSWIGNCIFVIIWIEFEPIWISLDMGFVGVHMEGIDEEISGRKGTKKKIK